ncbi:uncharacterized protein LOC126846570 [Adelges cooleyi]|uniref:uncharacterized protein LOC126846570 n=1 Tax=Adelges cooleyi TaxID=133065 RepID=UPI00217FE9E4|nr:uncharacterized protein LOC126846570 [Adelges cooleyi]
MQNKYELLGEITLYGDHTVRSNVKLLCSRLLAKHSTRFTFDEQFTGSSHESNAIDERSSDDFNTTGSIESLLENSTDSDQNNKNIDFKSSSSISSTDICLNIFENHFNINEQNAVQKSESCEESALKLNQEEQQHYENTENDNYYDEWYAYWEKYGDEFVNETWIKQYGSCTTDDLDMDVEQLYLNHKQQQYNILYWKFMEDKAWSLINIEKSKNENLDEVDQTSNSSYNKKKIRNKNDNSLNFDFIFKYKHFPDLNSKLVEGYRALSIMGFVYNDQSFYNSSFCLYHNRHLIKSTRHLNIYRFPEKKTGHNGKSVHIENLDGKKCVCSNDSSTVCGCPITSNNLSKKSIKKENRKKYLEDNSEKELEKFGYSDLRNNPKLLKYWKKRYTLFSKFAKGIRLDEESWYSVTPEVISRHIAERCSCYLLIDPFCGAGGNIIQFAMTCELVIAIDKDPKKIEIARHNAEVYGVADRIEFIIGDFFDLAPTLKGDVVFLSPPWGGPELMNQEEFNLSNIMPEYGGGDNLLSVAKQITSDIALHLPKNTNIFDCISSSYGGWIELQQNVLNSRYNSLTVYYGELYGLCDETTVNYCDEEDFF